MAQARTFTDQNIIDAALEITGQGKNINGTTLRRVVGSGRPATLMQAYEALVVEGKIARNTELVQTDEIEIQRYELPAEVRDGLSVMTAELEGMVQKCNDYAHHVVETRLNKAISEANKAKSSAEIQAAESLEQETAAFDQIEEKVLELDESNAKIESQSNQIAGLEKLLALKVSELTMAVERAERAESTIKDKDVTILSIGAEKDASVALRAKSEGALEQARENIAANALDIKNSKHEIKILTDARSNDAAALAELRTEKTHFEEKIVGLNKNVKHLDDMVGQEKNERNKLTAQCRQLQSELAQAKTEK